MKQSKSTEAVISLWTANTAIVKQLDNGLGAIHGIGFTEYMVLLHLDSAANKVMRRIDLATATHRSASGITRILKPMEKIGLVEKEVNPRDARVSLVKISTAGSKTFQQASKTFEQQSERILRRLTDKDIKLLLKVLEDYRAPI